MDVPSADQKPKAKNWRWIVVAVLVVLIGGCTAIGLLVDSKETRLAKEFLRALRTSDSAAQAKMCSINMTAAQVEQNRAGIVALRKDLAAKGWTGGSSLKKPKQASVGATTLTSIRGTLNMAPATAIDVGILKYKGSPLCVGNLGVNGKDIAR